MGIRFEIEKFKLKQVLNKEYQKYSKKFETKNWWGEYNKKFDFQIVEQVLEAFDNRRDQHFDLVYQSDYKDTYRSRDLDVDIYIKHYRVFEAKYSKTAIYRRNIIRRLLAKKSFATTFLLQDLGVNTIESLFYAGDSSYFCKNGLYVSIAEPSTVPIPYLFKELSSVEQSPKFTESFQEDIIPYPIDSVLEAYGEFIGKILEAGVRGNYREQFNNTLIRFTEKSFNLVLCDQDIISAIFPYSDREKALEAEKYKKDLERHFSKWGLSLDLRSFERGIHKTCTFN